MKLGAIIQSFFGPVHASDPDFRQAFVIEVESTFRPLGFAPGAVGTWVQSERAPIRQIVQITGLKAQACSLLWGLSFDFAPMPDEKCQKLIWHSTAKMAVPMLVEDPIDNWTHGSDPELRVMPMTSSHANGKTSRRLLDMAVIRLQRMQTLDDAIAAFEAWKVRPFVRFGYANYWKAPIAHAFCLAKAGRKAEAAGMLEDWIRGHPHAASALIASLRQELEAV